ncbi:alpha/beta hydrolase [Roseomonas harenae]|uniref:alpha/beta hydrolase n=1 Tax=Muricoccus harenae TaxID=2692566 RepID=UPI0013319F73|nr:alpha/beta hydrolase [Roseomonas harenae]
MFRSHSLTTNAFVDNVPASDQGGADEAAGLCAGGHDLRDPLTSPILGDFTRFPPTVLTSGTRELFLSHTLRARRKLRQAVVEAALHVFEGQSHAQYLDPFMSETERAFGEIARLFNQHLLT